MTSVEITRNSETVEIRMGYSTYVFTPKDYDTLFHAMREVPASDVVWQSMVTQEFVAHLSDIGKGKLINDLDDYVADRCTE